MVASLIFGWLYEAYSRKCVLITSFILLSVSMSVTFWSDEDNVKTIKYCRISVCILVQAILQNPLLNDYIKRRNRGWANGFQRLGYTIGEILSFLLLALEVHEDEHAQDVIYYIMTALVLVLGLFVSCFLVKDRKIPRNYVKNEEGEVVRHPQKLQVDDDENDTGSDVDIGLPEGTLVIKAKKKNAWENYKLIWSQKIKAVKGDRMYWLVFVGTFVNDMCRAKFAMITMIWYHSHVMTEEEQELAGDDAYDLKQSETLYKFSQTVALTAVIFAVPMYGWLTDHLATEFELGLAYMTRCIAGFAFFSITDPTQDLVIWTIVLFMLSSNFEEVCIDSLFSKRIPGDIRGAMQGLQEFFGKLGHFTFALIAVLTVEKHGIHTSILTVAIADATMIVIIIIVNFTRGFDEDPAAGTDAREKGKEIDAAAVKEAQAKEAKLTAEIARLREEVERLRTELAKRDGTYVPPENEDDTAEGKDGKVS